MRLPVQTTGAVRGGAASNRNLPGRQGGGKIMPQLQISIDNGLLLTFLNLASQFGIDAFPIRLGLEDRNLIPLFPPFGGGPFPPPPERQPQ